MLVLLCTTPLSAHTRSDSNKGWWAAI